MTPVELREMASRKGFEPLTYGLGNRCSILLNQFSTFVSMRVESLSA